MAERRAGGRFSCERCFQRKVKCDKEFPCQRCADSGLDCVTRLPTGPRRRNRRDQLVERLNRANQLLRHHANSETAHSPSSTLHHTVGQGKLFKSEGSLRFVDNDLWNAVGSELPDTDGLVDEQHSENEDDGMPTDGSCELIMGLSSSPDISLKSLQPSPANIRHLWQVFLENVNPLSKLIHRPTTAALIDRACNQIQNLEKADEVLLFGIYLSAVVSLTAEQCRRLLRETRACLSLRYQIACREALVRAKFLKTSSLQVLAGFVMYLQALRNDLDSRTFWALTGVANRIAQGLGLHQYGADLGLPIFETEMRSRIWWQVLWLEFRSAERTGSGHVTQFFLFDIKPPRNIDDRDFWPGQTEKELESVIHTRGEKRATEMMNILILCENANFWREQMTKDPGIFDPHRGPLSPFGVKPPQLKPWEMELGTREDLISELERRLEDRYIRYCDPAMPSQLLASIHIRGSLAYMRLMTHHPRRWAQQDHIPDEQRQLLWGLCMRILDLDALQRTTPFLQKFAWKLSEYFQWQALVYVLQELRKEPTSDVAADGFARIHDAFRNHPAFMEDHSPLHNAISSLALKAWDARAAALQAHGSEEEVPSYVEQLLQRRAATENARPAGTENGRQQARTAPEAASMHADTTSFNERGPPAQQSGEPSTSPMKEDTSFQQQQQQQQHHNDVFMGNGELQDATFMDWDMWDHLIQDFQQGDAPSF